jgi:hypothetical protein
MMAALGCLPITLIALFAPCVPWQPRLTAWLFFAGIGVQWRRRRHDNGMLMTGAKTGAWLMPAAVFICAIAQQALNDFGPNKFEGVFYLSLIGCSLFGLVAGIVTTEQFEAMSVLGSRLRGGLRGGVSLGSSPQSSSEFLDEHTFPLEAPPVFGLPRQFGVRGLLIATTWAAVLLSYLRVRGVEASVYFMALTFLSGTLAAQALLFQGQRPIRASAWAGAILLPILTLAANLLWPSKSHPSHLDESIFYFATQCACLVPAGIVLGAIVGAVAGAIYSGSEELLTRLSGGVPKFVLEPIAEADADVLLSWIIGPKLCHRWAGDQLKWPLDREQLLQRFATARGLQPARFIFKAVTVRSGEMIAYAELSALQGVTDHGAVKLALVDPNKSERGRLTVRLFHAVAAHAFSVLGMNSVAVITSTDQPELGQLPMVFYKDEM